MISRNLLTLLTLTSLSLGNLLQACGAPQDPSSSLSVESSDPTGEGQLEIFANGEDFVRQGFVSKDGWTIAFDRLYVTLAEITAYQTDSLFNAESDEPIQAKQTVVFSETTTVDLAQGDENASPMLVQSTVAPAGKFNALAWKMVPGTSGETAGYSLYIQGIASKSAQTIPFILKFEKPLQFVCGEFIGDERKGLLKSGDQANLEATFHFDHLFGDQDLPSDDPLNQDALGFEPLAAIAQDNLLEVDLAALKQQLSPQDYDKLMEIFPNLGHVGEGHCREESGSND